MICVQSCVSTSVSGTSCEQCSDEMGRQFGECAHIVHCPLLRYPSFVDVLESVQSFGLLVLNHSHLFRGVTSNRSASELVDEAGAAERVPRLQR